MQTLERNAVLPRVVPVYDLLNAGPRHRFVANGKLIHNSDKINVQNLPSRGGDTTLRSAIIAPKGHLIIGADSSQIEARLNAYIMQETGLLTVFQNGADPYSYMASGIYGIPYEQVYHEAKVAPTKEGKIRRMVGKETVLACGYQMSGDKFAIRLRQQGILLPDGEPQRIVSVYRQTNARIRDGWRQAQDIISIMVNGGSGAFGGPDSNLFQYDGSGMVFGKRMATIRMPNGTYLRYYNLRTIQDEESGRPAFVYDKLMGRNFARVFLYGGKFVENLTQALAFAILKEQAVAMARRGVPIKLNVHDEWVTCVPAQYAAPVVKIFSEEMRRAPIWCPGMPLDCEIDVGISYGNSHTLEGV